MDDGSASVAESRKLLELLRQQGVKVVAATPHFYPESDTPESFLERRAEAFAKLERETGDPQIILGAEVAYFDGMSHSQELAQLQLGHSRLLLVEMPFQSWTDHMVEEICALPQGAGVTPVLAHVDRYLGSGQMRKYYRRLLANDVYFQCNAEVFTHVLRRGWILKLLGRGNIHFLGSDCHNLTTRPPKLDLAAQVITQKLGAQVLKDLEKTSQQLLGIE